MQGSDKGQAPSLDGSSLAIGIVQARFNAEITGRLADTCIAELKALGVAENNIRHVTVPGALEVGVALDVMATSDQYDALIALGCVYVRQCHLNTCPVGVATQDEKLRGKFKGTPEMVVNFFNAVAEEVRTLLASLGVASLEELIGRPEFLQQRQVPNHPKANMLDLRRLLVDVLG